jgi:hypothetical protein
MRIAKLRQGAAVRRGFRPYGHGSVMSHYYGAASEIAVARLLGVPLPDDWTWEGDKRRGGDLIADGVVYHVRSSRKGDGWMWRDGKDVRGGVWVFVDTSQFPDLYIAGWLTGDQAWLAGSSGRISRDALMLADLIRNNDVSREPGILSENGIM